MANANTIAGLSGFPTPSGNITTVETAFGISPANTVRAVAVVPASYNNQVLDGREMLIRYAVVVTTGGSITYASNIRFYRTDQTNLTTFTNDVAIATQAATSIATATRMVVGNARVSWDSTTARLNGSFCYNVDTAFTTWATLTAGLSANVATAPTIGFFITSTFGTANGSNNAILKYLEIDLL